MNRIWRHSIITPLIAVVIVAVGIVSLGELLLFTSETAGGTAAIMVAVVIMVAIAAVAAILARDPKTR